MSIIISHWLRIERTKFSSLLAVIISLFLFCCSRRLPTFLLRNDQQGKDNQCRASFLHSIHCFVRHVTNMVAVAPIFEPFEIGSGTPTSTSASKLTLPDSRSGDSHRRRLFWWVTGGLLVASALILGLSLGLPSSKSSSSNNGAANGSNGLDMFGEGDQWTPPASPNNNGDNANVGSEVEDNADADQQEHQPSPPENDTCGRAHVIPTNGSLVVDRTMGAGQVEEEECYPEGSPSPGVWYKVMTPTTAEDGGDKSGYFVATFNDMYTRSDTWISVYESTHEVGNHCDQLQCATDSLHNFDGHLGSAVWTAVPGKTYYLMVHRTAMEFALTVRFHLGSVDDLDSVYNEVENDHFRPPIAIDNQLCRDADPVAVSNKVILGMTDNSGTEIETVPVCNIESPGQTTHTDGGAWYSVAVATTTILQASFDKQYTRYDSRISIYENDCGQTLTCVTGPDYDVYGRLGQVTWTALPGVEYKVMVHHSPGEYGMVIQSVPADA